MTILFPSNFYTLISPENKDELVEVGNSVDLHENQEFTWGGECNVTKERIKIGKIAQLLIPALQTFFEEIEIPFNVQVEEGWRNTYKKEEFQDVHYHPEADLSAVLFLTENDGEFYFYNRNSVEVSKVWRDSLYLDIKHINASKGDVLFFPSHILHGVSPNRSEFVRRTVSINMRLIPPS